MGDKTHSTEFSSGKSDTIPKTPDRCVATGLFWLLAAVSSSLESLSEALLSEGGSESESCRLISSEDFEEYDSSQNVLVWGVRTDQKRGQELDPSWDEKGKERFIQTSEFPPSSTFGAGLRYTVSYSPHLRRSLPNMSHPMSTEPAKIYPYHLLLITNYRLPADVDRLNLERHLSDAEFEAVLQCSRVDFYRMPQWRRNDLKRRVRLF
uniref:(California timema) hypothetical protein n=1 Tax=Timema californicum TaxID=61474 RepID=A0A7R9J0U2_TIMCA|nr:unnamed protein product [Timema californicum]